MISRGRVDESSPALGLGPIAVNPTHQRQGIGGELLRAVIERAQTTEYTVIALLGHPTYYPRFGFRPGHELGIETTYTAPPEAWMVLPLPAYARRRPRHLPLRKRRSPRRLGSSFTRGSADVKNG